jgi:hypothetical protein
MGLVQLLWFLGHWESELGQLAGSEHLSEYVFQPLLLILHILDADRHKRWASRSDKL